MTGIVEINTSTKRLTSSPKRKVGPTPKLRFKPKSKRGVRISLEDLRSKRRVVLDRIQHSADNCAEKILIRAHLLRVLTKVKLTP